MPEMLCAAQNEARHIADGAAREIVILVGPYQ